MSKSTYAAALAFLSLLAGVQGAHARAPVNIELDGVNYCIGFNNSVEFVWPGEKPNNLQPGDFGDTGVKMSKWKYEKL